MEQGSFCSRMIGFDPFINNFTSLSPNLLNWPIAEITLASSFFSLMSASVTCVYPPPSFTKAYHWCFMSFYPIWMTWILARCLFSIPNAISLWISSWLNAPSVRKKMKLFFSEATLLSISRDPLNGGSAEVPPKSALIVLMKFCAF